ncbi:hypothetical protein DLAC_05123 [Tieghemostelium lacteum]|uniref:Uncharacterized protein n=1 Tax=Tieghemostelium lacteum TaxID=361077 RepID=A0A151ZIE1_TIELA|nr:hypothetical protein DLAC_05123 [Tieghemostelium lacteum]|eukprot:KYQ93733.1 hypothetical protein DLAC_05123 [Tieghemostelium lacteum]
MLEWRIKRMDLPPTYSPTIRPLLRQHVQTVPPFLNPHDYSSSSPLSSPSIISLPNHVQNAIIPPPMLLNNHPIIANVNNQNNQNIAQAPQPLVNNQTLLNTNNNNIAQPQLLGHELNSNTPNSWSVPSTPLVTPSNNNNNAGSISFPLLNTPVQNGIGTTYTAPNLNNNNHNPLPPTNIPFMNLNLLNLNNLNNNNNNNNNNVPIITSPTTPTSNEQRDVLRRLAVSNHQRTTTTTTTTTTTSSSSSANNQSETDEQVVPKGSTSPVISFSNKKKMKYRMIASILIAICYAFPLTLISCFSLTLIEMFFQKLPELIKLGGLPLNDFAKAYMASLVSFKGFNLTHVILFALLIGILTLKTEVTRNNQIVKTPKKENF